MLVKCAEAIQEGILAGMDIVLVGAFNGIELGVGKVFNRNYIENSNIIGERFVKPLVKVKIPSFVKIEMEKELPGMNASIGTSASYAGDFGFEQFAHCLLDYLLNGYNPDLSLPTPIVYTVERNMCKISQINYFILIIKFESMVLFSKTKDFIEK
jgi:hypothetical protein